MHNNMLVKKQLILDLSPKQSHIYNFVLIKAQWSCVKAENIND